MKKMYRTGLPALTGLSLLITLHSSSVEKVHDTIEQYFKQTWLGLTCFQWTQFFVGEMCKEIIVLM